MPKCGFGVFCAHQRDSEAGGWIVVFTKISSAEKNDFSLVWDYTNKADFSCLYTVGVIMDAFPGR